MDKDSKFMPKQDDSYKLKFNPKKKCSRCEQLGVFLCEVVYRLIFNHCKKKEIN